VQARVNRELCRGCGQCRDACLHEAIRMVEWRAGFQAAEVDPARCRGCGTCLTVCPSGALSDYRGGRS
jgi:ferredoxin